MGAVSPARVEARIKQLCCLGLGGEAVMPALLRELHALIPSYSNTFFWADENFELSNIYDECPESDRVGPLYVQEFYNRRECDVHRGFSDTMRRDVGVVTSDQALTVDKSAFHRSDLYNLIFRSLNYHDFLRLMVREDGRALGALQVWRTPKDRPFTPEEQRRLGRLQPFLAHALTERGGLDPPLAESGESGLIIADRDGRPIFLSPEGRRLLFLATHPKVAPAVAAREPAILPDVVVRLCQNLVAVFAARQSAPPPVCRHRNVWGGFTFRAYWLETAETAPDLIGITVSYEEPLAIRLMRGMEAFRLTPRQAEICLMMARGLSYGSIAERLDISKHTAITHSRSIYGKLEVHDRTELSAKLLC